MTIKLQHAGIDIQVSDGPYVENGVPTQAAIDYYLLIINMIDELKQFSAKKLLRLYNDTWFDDAIGKLDQSAFAKLLTVSGINIYDELGYALVYFDDGEIFAGHSIEITLENGKPVDAEIVG